jgi:hypothetical protein
MTVYFGQFFENYIFVLFFPQYRIRDNFDKNGLGYILGDVFTNSSGHHAQEQILLLNLQPQRQRFNRMERFFKARENTTFS